MSDDDIIDTIAAAVTDPYKISVDSQGSKILEFTPANKIADSVLTDLRAAGYAVVRKPTEMVDRSNVATMLAKCPMWTAGDSWACVNKVNGNVVIEFETVGQQFYGEINAMEAREFASVLLAAADAAEEWK